MDRMKVLVPFLLLAFSANCQSGSSGHVFYAPTLIKYYRGHTGSHGLGGGYDKVFWRGLGFAGDLGWFWPGDRPDSGVGLGSLNSSYDFVSRHSVEPFVTGGYGFAFRSRVNNMANFGGGVDWWLGQRTGLRLEIRDHTDMQSRGDHLISFRIGLGFR